MKCLKTFFPWLVLGLIVRLVLIPITLHPDLWAVSFSQYFFAFKGVFNIYDYLAGLPAGSFLVKNYGQNFFTYPPLAYYTLGIFGLILKPFYNRDFFDNLAQNLPVILNDYRLYWHLFLTKLPYLFFDFGCLLILRKLFTDEKKEKLVTLLWLFNPLVLYTTYMIGQFDIIPVFFVLLSLYLAKRNKISWAVLALGIGGAYKMFPLFFVPFLVMAEAKNISQKVKLLVIGMLPYLFSLLPFVNSAAFRQNVLFSNQSQKMLFAKISVSGAEYLSVFVVLYIFLCSAVLFKRLQLWQWFLLVMLLFFSVTHYHPQWFLWLSPLLLLFWVENKKFKIFPIFLLLSWLMITLLFEPSLSISLFAPIYKPLSFVPSLSEQLNRYYDIFAFKSLIRSFAAGISISMAALLFLNEKTD